MLTHWIADVSWLQFRQPVVSVILEALCCFYQTFVIKSKLWTFRLRAVIVLTACENITYIKPLHHFKWIASLRVLFVALQKTAWANGRTQDSSREDNSKEESMAHAHKMWKFDIIDT